MMIRKTIAGFINKLYVTLVDWAKTANTDDKHNEILCVQNIPLYVEHHNRTDRTDDIQFEE